MKKYIITIAVAVFFTSCVKDELDPVPSPSKTPQNLKELSYPFGAAVNDRLIREIPSYKSILIKEFSSVTSEASMKIMALLPVQRSYDFTRADNVIAFAKENGIRVHGHTLIWHNSLPDWLTSYQGNATAWENLFKEYITTVVTHFKGKVASWDVVNEAIDDDGSLRNSLWLQKLGPDYIARAFQYAHQADPAALLFYNDYGQEKNGVKRNAIFALITSLKAKGVPIHGVGLQMHINYLQDNDGIAQAIKSAASTGLKVHISELDVSLNFQSSATATYNQDLGAQQKAKYKFVVQAYQQVPANQRFGITTWGVDDQHTYLLRYQPDWPLLFDPNFQPKPAYYGVLEGAQ